MTATLKRGLGSRKDVQILVLIILAGAAALIWTLWFRVRVEQPGPPPAATAPSGELEEVRDKARGPARVATYSKDDQVRVVERAVGEWVDGEWRVVPANTILTVRETEMRDDEVWVQTHLQRGDRPEHILIHASFLESYRPVVLNQVLEIAGVRFVRIEDTHGRSVSVNGWLRNVTAEPLNQCVLTCTFLDGEQREVDAKVIPIASLAPNELYRFQTLATDKAFTSVSIQITYLAANRQRRYLSNVAINRSAE